MTEHSTINSILPEADKITICFAHGAYDMKPVFDGRDYGVTTIQVDNYADLEKVIPEVDVLVTSMMWKNDLLPRATKLKYLQSVSSGTNQYDKDAFAKQGIRLASGQGVNMNAVSEHAIGLLLSLTRRLATARDNQHKGFWRPEQRDPMLREDELAGKTMIIVGTGGIGNRIAKIAKALDMTVIGVRRDPAKGKGAADEMYAFGDLHMLLPRADVVVLSCPLTDETAGIIDAKALGLMTSDAILINVARGGCVDQAALTEALAQGRIAGAGLDVFASEPLAAESPLWKIENVVATPHTAGETRRYELNVLNLLEQNLQNLWMGRSDLVNQIV
jgi:phosphoglycerate dehydrogenase-like enzyme